MKLQSLIGSGAKAAAMGGLAIAAGLVVTSGAKADEWDKKTILTVNQPIQISDTYLDPGKYVLMLDRSSSDRHIVRIYNDRQDHLINTILALPAYRLRATGSTVFTFWETPPNTARALRDWYWPGDNFGQEFPYPKHLRELAAAVPAPAPPAPPREEAVPAPAPQAEQKVEQQTEIAQAAPPPPPPAPEAAPAPEQPKASPAPEAPQPRELPKTATPYPLVGFGGLLSLGIYGLARARGSAQA
ncbi:MAG TPA: hypothetical protein VKV74_07270 [Bryobacteraceae bacterium]|nr:hypothetical protein [Bryobacteraceae bacterium]